MLKMGYDNCVLIHMYYLRSDVLTTHVFIQGGKVKCMTQGPKPFRGKGIYTGTIKVPVGYFFYDEVKPRTISKNRLIPDSVIIAIQNYLSEGWAVGKISKLLGISSGTIDQVRLGMRKPTSGS